MMTWRGEAAALYWSYLPVAKLGQWTLNEDRVTATIVEFDTLRIEQPGLTFRVEREHAAPWVWRVDALEVANGTLTARLSADGVM